MAVTSSVESWSRNDWRYSSVGSVAVAVSVSRGMTVNVSVREASAPSMSSTTVTVARYSPPSASAGMRNPCHAKNREKSSSRATVSARSSVNVVSWVPSGGDESRLDRQRVLDAAVGDAASGDPVRFEVDVHLAPGLELRRWDGVDLAVRGRLRRGELHVPERERALAGDDPPRRRRIGRGRRRCRRCRLCGGRRIRSGLGRPAR
jgi:hypothetical protein